MLAMHVASLGSCPAPLGMRPDPNKCRSIRLDGTKKQVINLEYISESFRTALQIVANHIWL